MVEFKVVISDSKGNSTSQEIKDKGAQPLLGAKIGDIIDSAIFGFKDGKIKVTGGSDKSGTPMRSDLSVGARNLDTGERKRKLVRGNLITEEIYQLNCQLIDSLLPSKEQAETSKAESNQ